MMGKDTDYSKINRAPVSVSITLQTGVVLRGILMVSRTRTLADELNRGEPFIEFEPHEGDRMYIARSSISAVKEMDIPRTDGLAKKLSNLTQFDPYETLGVTKQSSTEEIRLAYLKLAKSYHPDRFAMLDLPHEVVEYLSAVATRVNLAYSELRLKHGNRAQEQPRAEHAA
ncbi:MAG: J domain-containing protein [Hyphomicrobiaceae bacterium]